MLAAVASVVITCLSLTATDGDTIRCDGVRMRDMGPGEPFKSGYDAPEIGNAKCAHEKLLGEQAKRRLQELLDQHGTYVVDSGQRDRFGRPLVWVRLRDGTSAGELLMREGYAVPWKPGKSFDWCEAA